MALDKLQFDRTAAAPGTFSTDMLNRIEDWTAFLADKLRGYGYWANITPRNAERPQTSRLPDGYTELEYIQSSGTQYIKTDVLIDSDGKVDMDVEIPTEPTAQLFVFGVSVTGDNERYGVTYLPGDKYWRNVHSTGDGSEANFPTKLKAVGRHRIVKDGNRCTIDGITMSTTQRTFTSSRPVFLFARNQEGSPIHIASARLYSCKMYRKGALVREFIPCKNASGTVGLYDLVGKKFYTNAGTGVFIAGAEAPPPELLDPALWYQSDIPTRGEIDRIRRNVDALQTGFARLPDWREILYNNTVDFGQANALEWDLQRIYDWMNAMVAAFLTRQANTIFMQAGGILNA